VYSIARLRFPAESVIRKIERALEDKFPEFDSKDTALIVWAFARVNRTPIHNKFILRSKVLRQLHLATEQEGYFLSDESSLLKELEVNIVQ
jgi:hypothetical protein